jgi:hypothetical protein
MLTRTCYNYATIVVTNHHAARHIRPHRQRADDQAEAGPTSCSWWQSATWRTGGARTSLCSPARPAWQPWSGGLCPIRARAGCTEACFRWSGRTRQSSPEPCAQVRILPGATGRSINSNTLYNLGGVSCWACDLRQCAGVRILRLGHARKRAPTGRRRCSAVFGDNGRQAVIVTETVALSPSIRSYAAAARAAPTPSGRGCPASPISLDATWPTCHTPS